MLRIVAISGSLRSKSCNTGLLRAAAELCPDGATVDVLSIKDLPLYNGDLEATNTIPPSVAAFRDSIFAADAVIFACPEYNYSLSPAHKNAIDWGTRPNNVWNDKPVAICSAAGGQGGFRAQYHLRQVLVFLNMHPINKPEVGVRIFQAITSRSWVVCADVVLGELKRCGCSPHAVCVLQNPSPFTDGELTSAQTRDDVKALVTNLVNWTQRIKKPA